MDKPLKAVTHGQCDVRPTVTFPAAGHHRPLDRYQIMLHSDRGNFGEERFPRLERGNFPAVWGVYATLVGRPHTETRAPGSPAILPATRQTCVAVPALDGILENCNNWQDPQNCAADYISRLQDGKNMQLVARHWRSYMGSVTSASMSQASVDRPCLLFLHSNGKFNWHIFSRPNMK